MKKTITAITLLLFFLTTNCQTIKEKKNKEKYTPSVENPRKVLIGFNQNFSMMPNMNEAIYKNIQLLKPQMLRYPGGTVTHSWNWKEGVIMTRKNKSVHPIVEIKTLTDYTNADFVFVLDILNKTLSDQIEIRTRKKETLSHKF